MVVLPVFPAAVLVVITTQQAFIIALHNCADLQIAHIADSLLTQFCQMLSCDAHGACFAMRAWVGGCERVSE